MGGLTRTLAKILGKRSRAKNAVEHAMVWGGKKRDYAARGGIQDLGGLCQINMNLREMKS